MNKMARFLFFSLAFLAGFLLLAAMVFYAGQQATGKPALYKVTADKTVFIFGHSRTAYAYNDSLMKATRNFANAAEPYFFTAAKLKQVLKANPAVKRVVVELSEIHMSQQQTDMWTYDASFLAHHLPNYSSIIDAGKHWQLVKHSTKTYFNLLPLISRQNLPFIIKRNANIFASRNFGGYLVHDSSLLDKPANQQAKVTATTKQSGISNDLQYLDEIVAYCKEQNIQLILLRSPVHKAFNMKGHDSLWNAVYAAKYKEYPVIDLTAYPLPDRAFYDYHHLNRYGAAIISPKLDSAVQQLKKN
jgi:hypothetical protein